MPAFRLIGMRSHHPITKRSDSCIQFFLHGGLGRPAGLVCRLPEVAASDKEDIFLWLHGN